MTRSGERSFPPRQTMSAGDSRANRRRKSSYDGSPAAPRYRPGMDADRTRPPSRTSAPASGSSEAEPAPAATSSSGRFPSGTVPPVTELAGTAILEGLADRRTASERAFEKTLGGEHHPAYIHGDLVYEHLAWRFAYKDALTAEDDEWLSVQGFRAGKPVHGVHGFAMMSFVPVAGSDRAPVLAFRGTDDLKDLSDDLNPKGVGMYQLAANEGKIAAALAALQGHGQAPAVTGHSLGGALAQLAAARFPDLVSKIVTFQAPGISKKMSARIEDSNQQAAAAGKPELLSHHFSIKDDLVSQAGETHTPGTQTQIDLPGVSFFLKHAGNKDTGNYNVASCIAPKTSDVDSVRVGVGRVLAMLGSYSRDGIDGHTQYIEVWERVRDALDRNASFEEVSAIVDRSSVPAAEKAQMQENLRQIRDAHTVTASPR